MNCYLETLNESELKDVETYESNSVFKFGGGRKVESMKKMKIPARIGCKDVKIETDVVNTNIPLLGCIHRRKATFCNYIVAKCSFSSVYTSYVLLYFTY